MKRIHSIPELMLLMIFYNTVPLWDVLSIPTGIKAVLTVFLSVIFIVILLRGGKSGADDKRLRRIDRGCSLLWLGGVSAVLEIIVMAVWFIAGTAGAAAKAGAIAMAVLGIGITALTGAVRVAVSSKQIKLKDHVMMLLWWWVPIVNVFLFRRFYKTAQREYIVESDRLQLENARAESEICRTKYPVLMVHGIFFRDWQLMNYWGRVPASLKRNGATVYYGNQQSARAVKDSAAELRATILTVLEETGAEKVNIIAHSKGGLDSRYAISCLGMDKHVATLTTINTPHRGCDMVDFLLDKLPDSLAQFIARHYNKIFTVQTHSGFMKRGRHWRIIFKALSYSGSKHFLTERKHEFLYVHRIKSFHIDLSNRERELRSVNGNAKKTAEGDNMVFGCFFAEVFERGQCPLAELHFVKDDKRALANDGLPAYMRKNGYQSLRTDVSLEGIVQHGRRLKIEVCDVVVSRPAELQNGEGLAYLTSALKDKRFAVLVRLPFIKIFAYFANHKENLSLVVQSHSIAYSCKIQSFFIK